MATGLCGTCGGSTPGCGCYFTAGEGLVVSGDGSSGSPFIATVKSRAQLANPVRNASMAIAQTGTSIAVGASTKWVLDGWLAFRNAFATGMTVSQQSALSDTQGSGYAMRSQRDSGNTATDALYLEMSIPTADSVRFAGRQGTISFRARKGANFSASSGFLGCQVYYGTGTDQNLNAGFTGSTLASTASHVPTSSWATYSATFTMPSACTEIGIIFVWTPVGTAGAADYVDIKDLRIDEGPYALPHVPLPYALDLAECRRFFKRYGGRATLDMIGVGMVTSSTTAIVVVQFDVQMRASPSLTVGSVSGFTVQDGSVNNATSAVALWGGAVATRDAVPVLFTTTGLTLGRSCAVVANNTLNGYIDIDARI